MNEIERILKVLSRRTRNNPILIGDRGESRRLIDQIKSHIEIPPIVDNLYSRNHLHPIREDDHFIGLCTLQEYTDCVYQYPSIEYYCQEVYIGTPSMDTTYAILTTWKYRYEKHYGLHLMDEALQMASDLAHRYIDHRYLPEKALDLVEEACANQRVLLNLSPESDDVKKIRQELNTRRQQLQEAQQQRNLPRIAELEYVVIPKLMSQYDQSTLTSTKVSVNDIVEVMSRWTRLPVEQLFPDKAQN
jgi:ATP-dependent Clp protease ATP-binding subunit ClpA